MLRYIILEHHPNDSRLRIADDGICQTLSQRMGTGGGIAGTLDSNYYKGCGLRQGIEREVIVVRNGTDRNDCRPPNTED